MLVVLPVLAEKGRRQVACTETLGSAVALVLDSLDKVAVRVEAPGSEGSKDSMGIRLQVFGSA